MRKNFLEKRMARITAKRDALIARSAQVDDVNELRAINAQVDELNEEITDARDEIAAIEAEERNAVPADAQTRGFNPVSAKNPAPVVGGVDSNEYRTAFMNFICRGVAIPAELRADGPTTTNDMSATVPTTIMNEIVKKLESFGNIWNKVRKINVQGGVNFPILSLKPVATFVTETTPSTAQKIQANTSVSFSYYTLECKVSQTMLTNVVVLSQFESLFVSLVTEAMIKAIEIAIFNGTGTNEPKGITKDARITNVVEMTAADFASWAKWKKSVFAAIPKAYRNGVFVMAQSTFDSYIDAMVDTNGQPIGRVNYGIDGGEVYRFGGKAVETVETDIVSDFDSASAGDVVAVYGNLSDYAVNTNMQITTTKWVDNDNNLVKNKATMIVDGKVIDPNGFVIIKKKA